MSDYEKWQKMAKGVGELGPKFTKRHQIIHQLGQSLRHHHPDRADLHQTADDLAAKAAKADQLLKHLQLSVLYRQSLAKVGLTPEQVTARYFSVKPWRGRLLRGIDAVRAGGQLHQIDFVPLDAPVLPEPPARISP